MDDAHQSSTTITVKGLRTPLPLFCISSTHETTTYTWEKLGQPGVSFPSQPVIYVNEIGLYRCQLTDSFDDTTVESNIISVEVKPGKFNIQFIAYMLSIQSIIFYLHVAVHCQW